MNRNELNPDRSPQAAFGVHLRNSREARGWKQADLANRMSYSSSHISSVENGNKHPTLRFSRSADQVFGLVGTADSFERRYREIRHGSLLEGFPEYVGYEGRAIEIRVYDIGIIPGLLQTPEYAQVLTESAVQRRTITPEQATERLSVLAERQAALERELPPTVLVVMDESCIRRWVGGTAVMGAQLARLVELAEQPNIVLQVAPFDIGERRTFNLPVNLLTMADLALVAYAESQAQGYLDRERATVLPMLSAYHQLQAEALSQAQSVAMVNQLRKGTP
ncbi:Scr1 family TA system antitoxin-like transcriptional regulator [Streptomyces celluloflavus]|uniref:helix-turn-helix domain-containing protein n=1 Tax=Streptomyces celluloflavus TaxID=58344 RepID=UPI0036D96DBC